MLELWNNWYDTLASVEALATVIVIVLVAAGAITLAEIGGDKRVRQKIDLGETSANRSLDQPRKKFAQQINDAPLPLWVKSRRFAPPSMTSGLPL